MTLDDRDQPSYVDDEPYITDPRPYHRYDAVTLDDGRIECVNATDDPDDCGSPCGYDEWILTWRDRDAFMRACSGGSGPGFGCDRIVHLDGVEIVRAH